MNMDGPKQFATIAYKYYEYVYIYPYICIYTNLLVKYMDISIKWHLNFSWYVY